MTSERIKELQEQTAYPESLSVYNALLQVWNECEQEKQLILNGSSLELKNKCTHTLDNIKGVRDSDFCFHNLDFTGKCFKCGEQVLIKENTLKGKL